jgi:hypothetical protein
MRKSPYATSGNLKKCMKHLRIEIAMPLVAEIITNNTSDRVGHHLKEYI